jgi:hypothetical protein
VSDTISASNRERRLPHRHLYRLALAATLLLVLMVVGMLPIAIRSMEAVLGRGADPRFDLVTGHLVAPTTPATAHVDSIYANISIVDLDETTDQATLVVSGNRTCAATCSSIALTLASLDDDADERQGLPPSATIKLAPTDRIFSQSVQLPLRGQPSLYPFDSYHLWLGVGGEATLADGSRLELSAAVLDQRHAVVTVQNRVPDMIMANPTPIPPQQVHAESDPFGLVAVQALFFERPAYLKVLAVGLVLLIAISATLALFTRGLDELALGFGGLVLGVWGIRSVLMPQSIGTVTVIDLALSWLILLLLLGLALRAALHFHRHSEFPWSRPRHSGG